MAGRPPLPIGAYGKISVRDISGENTPKCFEAIAYYRDPDGVTRRVKARGPSRTGAENNLREAIAQRRHNAGAQLTPASRVSDAATAWFRTLQAQVEAGDKAPGTATNYESVWRVHIEPALGRLRLREATTARCEAWMLAMRERVGPAHCVKARAVLSSILGYAARMDALPANPVRDISPIPGAGGRKRKPRALTAVERTQLLAWLDTHVARDPRHRDRQPKLWHDEAEVIASRALGDVVRFMLGTGARIGEAMAVSWDEIDFEARTVAIRWHIVPIRGEGLLRAPGAKSEAGNRVLRVPNWCADMLLERRVNSGGAYPVFPNELGTWRDPGQIGRWLRWSREEAGFPWLTSHRFRQTVLTTLDSGGLSARENADHAGHSKITQTHDYMQRGIASERAAEILESMI